MKTGSKKLRYNLSGIMKYAHSMFNPNNESFSVRLKRAWALAKSYMASGKATGQFVVAVSNAPAQSYDEAVSNWYSNVPRGTYFGD